MKSMTGCGRGVFSGQGMKVITEVTSVNRKQSEVTVYLPREVESLEPKVRNELNRRLSRGRIVAKISLQVGEDGAAGQFQLNAPLAKKYAKELSALARELKISEEITLDMLIRVPGVLRTDVAPCDAEAYWEPISASLNDAVEALVKMRSAEGDHLAKDLKSRIALMKKAVTRIKAEAPGMVERYRENLKERVKKAGLDLPKDEDERLLKEIVYFADRSDISEELTRLQSHFKQFEDCAKSGEPVGRTLDFLAQEMNREINTIGSKAGDSSISREVVVFKAELEKFREQVQNVE